MKEMGVKELLEWLKDSQTWYAFLAITHPHLYHQPEERDIQAYNQLVKLINDSEPNESEKWLASEEGLQVAEDMAKEDSEPSGVDEELIEQMEHCISYPYDIGRMRWRGLMIKAVKLLSQKRVVGREEYKAVVKKAQEFWNHISSIEVENIIWQALKELGVVVVEIK